MQHQAAHATLRILTVIFGMSSAAIYSAIVCCYQNIHTDIQTDRRTDKETMTDWKTDR